MASPSSHGLDTELESFRRQWLSDLQQTKKGSPSSQAARPQPSSWASVKRQSEPPPRDDGPPSPISSRRAGLAANDDDDYLQGRVFDEPPPQAGHTLNDAPKKKKIAERLLVSALDHFEEAMEKEAAGNMGDSLKLYRTAYKLDHKVDRRYREKYFPQGASKPPAPSSSLTTTTTTSKSPQPTEQPPTEQQILQKHKQDTQSKPQSLESLLTSFSSLSIEPLAAEVEGDPAPPCPISALPSELLIHIFQDVAVADVADFARLALVCKHMAYLVAKEERIWRRVCLGTEFGFAGMPYHFQKTVEWGQLEEQEEELDPGAEHGMLISARELAQRRDGENHIITQSLLPALYPSWKSMFRERPRIRFNGCYISTVNYVRTGQASTNQATWGSNPIHIVTYYRYLRFFRDGTAISLLTTDEPGDVVHHLTRELLQTHRQAAMAHLPSAVMSHASCARWRLSSALDKPDLPLKEREGDLLVETEGVYPKYMHRMDLSLRSAGKLARNNKLMWRGYHSYNKLTDDWAEFRLKNDKPFFFSRVKSYGLGE